MKDENKNSKKKVNVDDLKKIDLIYDNNATRTAFIVGLLVNGVVCVLSVVNVGIIIIIYHWFIKNITTNTLEMNVFIACFSFLTICIISIITIITRSRNHEKQYPIYKMCIIVFSILTILTGIKASIIGDDVYKKIPEIKTSI